MDDRVIYCSICEVYFEDDDEVCIHGEIHDYVSKAELCRRGIKRTGTFLIDESEHFVGNPEECACAPFAKRCNCGGAIHYQPVYGGEVYQCDRCSGGLEGEILV